MGEPERLNGLLRENVVPVIGLRSPDMLQGAPRGMGVVGNDRGVLLVFASRIFRAHHQVLMPECLLLAALPAASFGPARTAPGASWASLAETASTRRIGPGFRHVFSEPAPPLFQISASSR